MNPTERALLIHKYLDNNLSPAELEWFERLIQHDAAFAQQLLEASLQHARMFKLVKTHQLVEVEKARARGEARPSSRVIAKPSHAQRIKTVRLATAAQQHPALQQTVELAQEKSVFWYTSRITAVAAVLLLGLWYMLPAGQPQPPVAIAHYAYEVPPPKPTPVEAVPKVSREPLAELQSISGQAVVERNGKAVPLLAGFGLQAGDVLQVLEGSAAFTYADGTRIELSRNAKLSFDIDPKTPGQKRLRLVEGSLLAEVMPQQEGRPMLIMTTVAEAKVLGTVLRLWVNGPQTRLATIKGKVQLMRTQDECTILVEAGQIAQVEQGVELEKYVFNSKADAENEHKLTHGSGSLDEGLVAHFTFDEGAGNLAKDCSRQQPDTRIYGPTWVPGVRGSALEFHGVNDYADFGNVGPDDNFNFRVGDAFTYSGWFQTTSDGGILLSQRDANPNEKDGPVLDIGIGHVNSHLEVPGHLEALIRDDRQRMPEHVDLHGGVVNDGRWHHFAVVRHSSGACELYCDGVRQAFVESRAAYEVTTSVRHFGCERKWVQAKNSFEPLRWFCGALDELRIYRRALAPGEILALASLADSP